MTTATPANPWPTQHLLQSYELHQMAERHDEDELAQERPANDHDDLDDLGWAPGALSAHADRGRLLEQLARVMPVYEAAIALLNALSSGGDMLAPTARVDALRAALEASKGTGDYGHDRNILEELAAWLGGQEGRKLEIAIDDRDLHCLITRPGEEPCPMSMPNRSKRTSRRWGDLADHLHTMLGIAMCVIGQTPSEEFTEEMEEELMAARHAQRPPAPELAPLFR